METQFEQPSLPVLTDFMNEWMFGHVGPKPRAVYAAKGGAGGKSLTEKEPGFGAQPPSPSSSRLMQEWLEEAKKMVSAAAPLSRHTSPARSSGSPRFAAASPVAKQPSLAQPLDRRDGLSRSARRSRAIEGISDEILHRSSARHFRNLSTAGAVAGTGDIQNSSFSFEENNSPNSPTARLLPNLPPNPRSRFHEKTPDIPPRRSLNTPPPSSRPPELPPRRSFRSPSPIPLEYAPAVTPRRRFSTFSPFPGETAPNPLLDAPLSPPRILNQSAPQRSTFSPNCPAPQISISQPRILNESAPQRSSFSPNCPAPLISVSPPQILNQSAPQRTTFSPTSPAGKVSPKLSISVSQPRILNQLAPQRTTFSPTCPTPLISVSPPGILNQSGPQRTTFSPTCTAEKVSPNLSISVSPPRNLNQSGPQRTTFSPTCTAEKVSPNLSISVSPPRNLNQLAPQRSTFSPNCPAPLISVSQPQILNQSASQRSTFSPNCPAPLISVSLPQILNESAPQRSTFSTTCPSGKVSPKMSISVSPPQHLNQSAPQRTTFSPTCPAGKVSPSLSISVSPPRMLIESNPRRSTLSPIHVAEIGREDDVMQINLFLARQREMIIRVSEGEVSVKARIVLSSYTPNTGSMVAAICYAWLLENTREERSWMKEEVVVPVINMRREMMWEHRQAAWLFHHVGIDASALMFSDELDFECLLMGKQLSLHVVGQDVLQTNGEVGSLCTVLTDNYCEDAYGLLQAPYLKRLLLAGILLETQNLNNVAKRNRDVEAVQLLLVGSSPNYRDFFFEQVMKEHGEDFFLEALRQHYGKPSSEVQQMPSRAPAARAVVAKPVPGLLPALLKGTEWSCRPKNKFSVGKLFGFGSK